MTPYTILGSLRLLTELDDDGAQRALPFCQAAFEQLMMQLKPGCDQNDARLSHAAAAIALCMLLLQGENGGGEDFSSFKAGDITITKQDKTKKDCLAKAERLKADALNGIQDLLRDTGFFAGSALFGKRKPKPTASCFAPAGGGAALPDGVLTRQRLKEGKDFVCDAHPLTHDQEYPENMCEVFIGAGFDSDDSAGVLYENFSGFNQSQWQNYNCLDETSQLTLAIRHARSSGEVHETSHELPLEIVSVQALPERKKKITATGFWEGYGDHIAFTLEAAIGYDFIHGYQIKDNEMSIRITATDFLLNPLRFLDIDLLSFVLAQGTRSVVDGYQMELHFQQAPEEGDLLHLLLSIENVVRDPVVGAVRLTAGFDTTAQFLVDPGEGYVYGHDIVMFGVFWEGNALRLLFRDYAFGYYEMVDRVAVLKLMKTGAAQ
jgi:hypothetical protein